MRNITIFLTICGMSFLVAFLLWKTRSLAAHAGTGAAVAMSRNIGPHDPDKQDLQHQEYSKALSVWHLQHNPSKAILMLKSIVQKESSLEPFADRQLGLLYAELKDYNSALDSYRAIFVKTHPWKSSDETNPVVAGEYADVALEIGAKPDQERAERIILDSYRPQGLKPELTWTENSDESRHALQAS